MLVDSNHGIYRESFRNASIDGGEVTCWVNNDNFAISRKRPLCPRHRIAASQRTVERDR